MSISIEFEEDHGATLSNAVLFYRSDRGDVFATEHDVKDGEIMEGHALNTKRMAEMLLKGTPLEPPRIVDPRVVVEHPRILAWWIPQGRRPLYFQKGKPVPVWLPPLLLIVRNNEQFYTFALPKNGRPGWDTKLMHAPLLNRYENGDLCMGSMPHGTDVRTWEESLFNSRFTHPHFTPKGAAPLYRAARAYPLTRLAPTLWTLGRFVSQL